MSSFNIRFIVITNVVISYIFLFEKKIPGIKTSGVSLKKAGKAFEKEKFRKHSFVHFVHYIYMDFKQN